MREIVRDRSRLEHILEAIDHINSFAAGKSKEQLESDKMQFYGLVKHIEIIGEAAYKLTRAFCREHPETPWESISKMRHVLIHDYYQIDANEVWKVINEDLGPLRSQVQQYITETDWDKWEQNEQVITETAVHKSLLMTAQRMKLKNYPVKEIISITGLSQDEIDAI